MAHALRGLVQQHQLRLHGQRGGNFKRTLAAIRQVDGDLIGHVLQTHFGQQLHGAVIELVERLFAGPEMKSRAQLTLQANAHVLQQSAVRKDGRDLKRANHAAAGNLCRRLAGDVHAIELDAAGAGLQKLGQQVETGGLAGTVGADQRMDGATLHCQIDLADGGKAFELFGELLGFENEVAHALAVSPECGKQMTERSLWCALSVASHLGLSCYSAAGGNS